MSFPKIIVAIALVAFSVVGVAAFIKKGKGEPESKDSSRPVLSTAAPLKEEKRTGPLAVQADSLLLSLGKEGNAPVEIKDDFPDVDRVYQLFATEGSRLPIVETITYSSAASWLKGRPAWLADYAAYYSTSRHFIARSLNGKPDYFSQNVFPGSRFNVFRNDKHITFYLLVDIKRCKMGFYYIDLDTNERVLLKTYQVGLGRLDPQKPSGSLTPLGKYTLGNKIAVYKPGVMGYFQDKKVEMISVFGTRWIPFDQEVGHSGSAASVKGYGIQGAPSKPSKGDDKEVLVEETGCIGNYDSDGCIRLLQKDMEELFAIIITKSTVVEIVKDFKEAKLPGVEVALPSR